MFQQKKVVLLMSTLHHANTIDEKVKSKNPKSSPFTSKQKLGGLDVADELTVIITFRSLANSGRPMTIFFGLLNMAPIYYVFRETRNRK